MPDTLLIACSIGSTTDVDISSGLAPGSDRATLTVAGSALGNKSTPRPWNENEPSTTSDITSIVAETGRRTQNSDNMKISLTGHCDELAAVQRLDVRHDDALAGFDAAGHFDSVAEPLAPLQLAHLESIAADDERAVHAVSVLQRGEWQREHFVHFAAFDVHAGERPGFEDAF